MSFTPTEYRAIAHYAESNDLIPQLSLKPRIRFMERRTGKMVERMLLNLVTEYEQSKKRKQA